MSAWLARPWSFLLAALAAVAGVGTACAETLSTPSYLVTIERQCPEGEVTCDRVSYLGENRKTGARLALRGETVHALCADGVTPCRFLGYRFKNGRTTYLLLEEGRLQVRRGGKLLLDEAGEWCY
jgi:hypothetical protein